MVLGICLRARLQGSNPSSNTLGRSLNSLFLFLNCKMGLIIVPPHRVIMRIQ